MKKLYTLLLAASVAASASADALKAPVATAADASAKSINVAADRARNAKAEIVKYTGSAATPAKAAPAKAAPTTMAELLGIYEYSIKLYTNTGVNTISSVTSLQAGEGENEVKICGLRYTDVTLVGTADLAAGTITLAPQELMELEPETPGVSEDIWLFGYDDATNKEDRTKNIVININADGTLSSNDTFVYGVEDMPGFSYAIFDGLTMTKSTTYNTIVTFQERDTDDEGYYLDTYTEYTDYTVAEHKEDYVHGGEALGECVVLSNFIFAPSATVALNPIPVQIERDTKTIFIDNWVWFNYNNNGTNVPVGIYGILNNRTDVIEGTYAGNTISWTGEWTAYCSLGSFGRFLGCKLILPFQLDENGAGINDVTVDNENAPVEYFNLQGIRVSEPAAGQVVIRRQGTNVQKVLVK